MPKNVTDFLPNITNKCEVFLFKDYVCIEHHPFRNSNWLGCNLCEILLSLEIDLPSNYNYLFLRDDTNHIHTTIKELGAYVLVINNKILFPQNEQDSLHGD